MPADRAALLQVLEAHVLACLTASCEQLILIGDHLQLRPKTQVRRTPAAGTCAQQPACSWVVTRTWMADRVCSARADGVGVRPRPQAAAGCLPV